MRCPSLCACLVLLALLRLGGLASVGPGSLAAADIDLALEDVPLVEALTRIRREGDLDLAYSAGLLVGPFGQPLRVTVHLDDADVLVALQVVAKACGVVVTGDTERGFVVTNPYWLKHVQRPHSHPHPHTPLNEPLPEAE